MLCSYRGKATGIISSFYLNIYIYIYKIFLIFLLHFHLIVWELGRTASMSLFLGSFWSLQVELAALMYMETRLAREHGRDGCYTFGAVGEAEVVNAQGLVHYQNLKWNIFLLVITYALGGSWIHGLTLPLAFGREIGAMWARAHWWNM